MFKPALSSDVAFATADEIQNAVSCHVDFAKDHVLQGFPDGSIYLQLETFGDDELIIAHINPQGKMTDLQSVELINGRVGEVTNEYKGELWNDLVEQGISAIS